jgi:hypothetical protein
MGIAISADAMLEAGDRNSLREVPQLSAEAHRQL